VDPHETLLWFLRRQGLTGTKEGCAEGECGACAVVLVRRDEEGATRYVAVNACLVLALAMEGQELLTVEGLSDNGALHPVQAAMVREGGSQCGYCTPGFVASMFAEHYRKERDGYDPEAISGNLCRCTGYRPIRDALRSLAPVDPDDRFAARLAKPAPKTRDVTHEADGARIHRPVSLAKLLELLDLDPGAKIVSGGTDVVVEVNQRDARFPTIVSLEAIPELHGIRDTDAAIEIGAAVPLAEIERVLHGRVPMLDQLWPLFSSRLIRSRATLGGNLVNASPIGDGPPALLALDAEVLLVGGAGERTAPLDGFFTGYRKTALRPGEIVRAVRIPKPLAPVSRFYKVSKRELDDISTVAAAFALALDGARKVTKARLAYGGVAATPIRAHDAERALVGEPFTPKTVARACEILRATVKPIDDHRGSAKYRAAMVERLLQKLWADTSMEVAP
jgi:xanthine dehydrogenase small subunit